MAAHPIAPAARIRQARLQLVERGIAPGHDVDACVQRSWRRSVDAGLSPGGRIHCLDNLSESELQRVRTLNGDLLRHSEPVMEDLFEQVRDSGGMVILADAQGVLMRTLGDLDFLDRAERVALTCGASWAERQRGTNAIGTALVECREVEIHGAEHYLERNGFLTCAAAPIRSARGDLLGVLDLSGDRRGRHPHTLGLVAGAARAIENGLFVASCRHHLVVQLHPRPEGLDTPAQGLLAFSDDGWLVGANRKALQMLGLRHEDLGGTSWPELFDGGRETLWAQARRAGGRPCALTTQRGETLHAQLRGSPAAARPVTVAAAPVRDALARLDTGDAQWRAAAERARRVIDKGIPLLVLGESGVGKELFSRAVHGASARRDRPFVAVNCAALPEHLIEAELFGYVPGAFTGALKQGSPGRLREAHGGTLFLDEIGDMPLALQTRLLRALQERQVTPVGSGTAVPVDFALMCATHQDLARAVEHGRFRADLYYRINGLAVRLPALRERSDFAELTRRLLEELEPGAGIRIDAELMRALARHAWPGNLRQYGHAIRTAVALLDPQETLIGWAHMPDDLVPALSACGPAAGDAPAQDLRSLSMKAIECALVDARGNVSAAARQLGISRQTLYRRLRSGTSALRSPVVDVR